MELNIKVCTSRTCEIIITDNTPVKDNIGYLPEYADGAADGRFRRSDTVSIDVLVLNESDGQKMQSPIFTNGAYKSVKIPIRFDGWFSIHHIVIPSKEWFLRELEKHSGSAIESYDIVYYSDGQSLFKYIRTKENPIEESAKLEELILDVTDGTTISNTYKDYISICFLKRCYLSLCQQIFNSRGFSKCQNKAGIDDDLIFRRDLVWMAINVINYRAEFNQLAEAQRIIEQIGGCNGLCKSEFKQIPTHGCGCSKG